MSDGGKKAAAFAAVEQHVKSGYKIGVGTGTTAKFVVDAIVAAYNNGLLTDIQCVPTSFQTRQLLLEGGVPVADVECQPRLNVCIDGADECDVELNCIKGGGGALMQEKIVQSCAERFVVVGHADKYTAHLGCAFKYVPLEVLPMAYRPVQLQVEKKFGGQCALRLAKCKIGPVVTDNGNFLLDWRFPEATCRWRDIDASLQALPGLLETGLFLGVADRAYFGDSEGKTGLFLGVADRAYFGDSEGRVQVYNSSGK